MIILLVHLTSLLPRVIGVTELCLIITGQQKVIVSATHGSLVSTTKGLATTIAAITPSSSLCVSSPDF